MTACIVSGFPWAAIADVTTAESPGAIICNDTRVTTNRGEADSRAWAKQELVARNIVVCYTSNNLGATATALSRVMGTKGTRNIGIALRNAHSQQGGFTEVLAVVWRGRHRPQILELMPPNYEPRPRRGVLGIGDADILHEFRKQFFDQPRPDLLRPFSEEVRARISSEIGRPYQGPRYTVHDAAGNVAAALVDAIQICRKPAVALPVQLSTVSHGQLMRHWATESVDEGKTWNKVSAGPDEVRPFPIGTSMAPTHMATRTAVQLFE